ncbi:MAG: hypothetical protein ACAI43_11595 [Phycisphaerae bacterium]|nr:hypothetical protein [Tepidisphaeraceae bacterium]
MSQDEIPDNLRTLINEQLDSVVQVEVLLLLHAQPAREFSAAAVARELRIEAAGAEAQLQHLRAGGMLESTPAGGYRYAARAPALAAAVGELARAYADRRVTVISLIYSKPRTDQVRTFADAFRLRKDKGNG